MLSLKYVRENLILLAEKFDNRNCDVDLKEFSRIDEHRLRIVQEVEALKNRRNSLSKEIGIAKAQGRDASASMKEAAKLSESIKELDNQLPPLEEALHSLLSSMPNICDEDVPVGRDESYNVVVKEFGEPRMGTFRSHDELLKDSELFDSERAVKISGSRFVLLRAEAAELERELANFMLREHKKRGYVEYSVPFLVRREAMFNSGQLPKFEEDAYSSDDNFLIPTGEVSLVNIFSGELLEEEKRLVTYSPCFRKESGSYGKDVKGLIRLHQFMKVELVKIVRPESSQAELESMVEDAENILKLLAIPYRVVLKCTGDTGFTASKTYDIEVWMPSQQKYREISSCSNTRDFQARRASIKIKSGSSAEHAHLLNGSGLAVGRTLAAFVENYQENGSISIKELLKKLNNC